MEVKTIGRCGKRRRLETADHPNLPDEVIFENIMTRVPVSTLMRCGCVCKHWYKSILQDPHFVIAYFAQQPKKDLPFVFYILNVLKDDENSSSKFRNRNYIFGFELGFELDFDHNRKHHRNDNIDSLLFDEKFVLRSEHIRMELELVGNCNGLVCLSRRSGGILILNPGRDEILTIFNPQIINDGHGGGCIICCYGFGFDSLTHEYMVVLIVSKNSEFKCLVFTLGNNSWRETSTTIPLPVTTTSFYKSAIFCDGALFWRTKSSSSDNNMLLLLFDIHDEEFQVIRLPAECASSSLLEPQYQIIDPLLEFKGSPCVARLEKTILGGGGSYSSTSTSTSSDESDDQNTSYCYKVHLHILKKYSKVGRRNEEVWIKETFDVAPHSFSNLISPAAPCFFTTYRAPQPPPNRIMSSSDGRVFLYCFSGGEVLQAYDLQTKRLYSSICCKFKRKKHTRVYDTIDYHLSGGHIENFMSMLAFIPKGGDGAPARLDRDKLISILEDEQRTLPVVGYVTVRHQKSAGFYLL